MASNDDLLERLRNHALGVVDMSASEVRAAQIVLGYREAAADDGRGLDVRLDNVSTDDLKRVLDVIRSNQVKDL